MQAVAHSPVTVVTILLPELIQSGRAGMANNTRTRLKNFRSELMATTSSQVFADTDQVTLFED